MTDDQPVPQRFRGLVEAAVALIREGRPGALTSDDRIAFAGDDPLRWLREDGVAVDLWGPDGRTEHTLEGTVTEGDDAAHLTVDDLHVL